MIEVDNGWRVGPIICDDTYFPEAARSAALHGAELLVIPFAGGTMHHWYDVLSIRAAVARVSIDRSAGNSPLPRPTRKRHSSPSSIDRTCWMRGYATRCIAIEVLISIPR